MRTAAATMVMMRALGELAAELYAVALRNHLAQLTGENARAAEVEKAQWAPSALSETTARASSNAPASAETATGKPSCEYESAAASGEWLSQDPLGAVDSYNLYAFNKFDPVNFVDPWGLKSDGLGDAKLRPLHIRRAVRMSFR